MRISDWSSDVCSSDLNRGRVPPMFDHARPRRSVLYMPGSNARALEKGRSLPADGLILDLEDAVARSEEHTSELQSLMRISYAVFCLKNKKPPTSHYTALQHTCPATHTTHKHRTDTPQ